MSVCDEGVALGGWEGSNVGVSEGRDRVRSGEGHWKVGGRYGGVASGVSENGVLGYENANEMVDWGICGV